MCIYHGCAVSATIDGDYWDEQNEALVDKKDDLQPDSRVGPLMITRVNVNYDPGPDSGRPDIPHCVICI